MLFRRAISAVHRFGAERRNSWAPFEGPIFGSGVSSPATTSRCMTGRITLSADPVAAATCRVVTVAPEPPPVSIRSVLTAASASEALPNRACDTDRRSVKAVVTVVVLRDANRVT